MVHLRDAERKRLFRACQCRVGDVDVVDEYVLAVLRCDERLPIVVDVLELVREPRRIVQIGQLRRTEFLSCIVQDRDGFTRGAEQHSFASYFEVVLRVRREQGVPLCRYVYQVFDERTRKSQTAVVIERAAPRQCIVQYLRDRFTDADVLEYVQCGIVDSRNVRVGKRAILAAA